MLFLNNCLLDLASSLVVQENETALSVLEITAAKTVSYITHFFVFSAKYCLTERLIACLYDVLVTVYVGCSNSRSRTINATLKSAQSEHHCAFQSFREVRFDFHFIW